MNGQLAVVLFYHSDPGNHSQVFSPGSRGLDMLNGLAGPQKSVFNSCK